MSSDIGKQGVTVVIPTRNEEGCVADVIQGVQPYASELIVVDGHSTDRTRDVAEKLGVRVVLDNGQGKGAAIREGLHLAQNEIVVFIDADGSHLAADIPKLVAPIAAGQADLVVGSRMMGGSDELHGTLPEAMRLIGSTVITQCINLRFGVTFTDYQNGFRAVRKSVGLALDLRSAATTIEQEMCAACLRMGYRMAEVPAHEYRRVWGESKIHILRHSHRYLLSLIRILCLRRKGETRHA